MLNNFRLYFPYFGLHLTSVKFSTFILYLVFVSDSSTFIYQSCVASTFRTIHWLSCFISGVNTVFCWCNNVPLFLWLWCRTSWTVIYTPGILLQHLHISNPYYMRIVKSSIHHYYCTLLLLLTWIIICRNVYELKQTREHVISIYPALNTEVTIFLGEKLYNFIFIYRKK